MASVISVDSVVVSEADGFADFTVRLDVADPAAITVNYTTGNGTATAGAASDFIAQTGLLTFAAGETVKVVRVTLVNGTVAEPIEGFNFTLFSPSVNAVIGNTDAIATIVDNDTATASPVLSVGDVIVDESAGEATFVVRLNQASTTGVSVNYTTVNGTALAGTDFTAAAGALNFAAGETVKTVKVSLLGDALAEFSETFGLSLSGALGATLPDSAGTAVIAENGQPGESTSVILVDSVVVSEDAGYAEFVVRLDRPNAAVVAVNYTTANGSAVATSDVLAQAGVLQFAAGETTKVVRVVLVNDTVAEPVESFVFNLFSPSANAVIGSSDVIATVIDNDAAVVATPLVSVSDVIVDEASKEAVFVVTLNRPSAGGVTLNYATTNGSALAGTDYSAASGTLSFVAGEMSKTVRVALLDDTLAESSESFGLTLGGVSGATLTDTVGSAVINENDQPAQAVSVIRVDGVVVSEGAGYAEFVIRLDAPNTSAVGVNYTTDAASALGTSDVIGQSGVVWFAPGETTQTVRVILVNDTVAEPIEGFYFTLFSPSANAFIGTTDALATVIDNDTVVAVPVMSIGDVIVDETARQATFVVRLAQASNSAVSVTYATVDGTAQAGSDYGAATGTLSFAAGETVKTVSVNLLDDTLAEATESFGLQLGGVVGATLPDAVGTAMIVANDPPAESISVITVDDVVVSEDAGYAEFVVRLDRPNTAAVSVNYAMTNGNAVANTDYFANTGLLTFAAGETTQVVRLALVNDTVAEPVESFNFRLFSQSANALIGKTDANATVIDNDSTAVTPLISVSDRVIDEGGKEAVFVVRLSQASTTAVSVNYATANGAALAGTDYSAASGTLSFAAGEVVKTVRVALIDDALAESSEAFSLTLSGAIGATLTDTAGVAVIAASDAPAQATSVIHVDDVVVGEADGYADFVVRIDAPNTSAVGVNYTVSAASAVGTSDLVTQSGVVYFGAGETTQTVRVVLVNDTVAEPVESFNFTLFSQTANAFIGNTDAIATIVDNDATTATPVMSVSEPIIDESSQEAVFVVRLSQASTAAVSVNYATLDGTALAGTDYSTASGTLSFAAGETVKSVRVGLINDTLVEASERFGLALSGVSGATLADPVGDAFIAENDQPALSTVTISVDNVVASESTGYAEFVVRLDAPSTAPVSVNYTTTNASAVSTSDFLAQSGALVFAAGETTQTVRVVLVNDTIAEPTESFFFSLFSQSANAFIGNTDVIATVIDNDTLVATPLISVSDISVDEGAHEATFVVRLDGAAAAPVSVNYATANGSALAASDFDSVSGTLNFAAGETVKTVTVALRDDTVAETAEHFNLVLSGASGASLADGTGTALVAESDQAVQSTSVISVDSVVASEGGGYAEVVVRLNGPNASAVSVNYTTANATAVAATDVSGDSGALVFAAGETVKVLRFALTNDTVAEPIESFSFTLFSQSANAVIGNTDAVITVIDNDAAPGTPVVRVGDLHVDENAGRVLATFVLDRPSTTATSLTYAVQALTATAGSDFNTPATATVTFAPGETVKSVAIGLVNDTTAEAAEVFSVAVTSVTGLTVGDGLGHIGIAASDAAAVTTPVLNVIAAPSLEGAGYSEFLVTLSSPSANLVSVNYTTGNATALAGSDFTAQSGFLAFAPGETVKTVRVVTVNDTTVELAESFNLTLFSASGATIGAALASAQLIDDDSALPASLTSTGTGVADYLHGTDLIDVLDGLDGNDLLDGGAGADTMLGGLGNDICIVDDVGDVVTENLGAGTDLVISHLNTHTLAANVENLVLGVSAVTGIGNALNNSLVGNALANNLQGGAGADALNGGAGADTLTGGDGSDSYTVDNAADVVIETNAAAAGGTDLVNQNLAAYTLGANVENGRILATGVASLTGNALNNVLYAGAGNNVLDGGAGTDTAAYTFATAAVGVSLLLAGAPQATGGSASDTLISIENLEGSAFADTLTGDAAANQLNGGVGADTLTGGDGNDTYLVDNAGDQVVEANAAAAGGTDLVLSSLAAYTLGANVEQGRINTTVAANLTGNALNNLLTAGAGNNLLDGAAGTDTASYSTATAAVAVSLSIVGAQTTGGSGSDTLVAIENLSGSSFADALTGNAGANALSGGAGNDTLTGAGGADTLTGSTGNDTYVVDNTLDVVTEATVSATEIDTVISSVTWTLGSNLDNLTLSGALAINGTGNTLNNVITGNAAVNVLNGGTGADTLIGGDGSDSYTVDNAGDVVTESNALAAGGSDTVSSLLAAYTLGTNVENGRVLAVGAANLTGNTLANTLFAGTGNNVINGGTGVDTVSYQFAASAVTVSLATAVAQATVGSGSDTLVAIENLTGSAFNDTLGGNASGNAINGGVGADTMTGGDGSDTYTVDNVGDLVVESNAVLATGGTDTVNSSLAAYTLSLNVENGRVLAAGAANLTGNALGNTLSAGAGDNVLDGGAGTDTASYQFAASAVTVNLGLAGAQATGGSGSDTLVSIEAVTGSNLADNLIGNAAANALNGGLGADALTGGDGSDTYTVDNVGDVVTETNAAVAGGLDTVQSSLATYALGAHVENGRILATTAASITGNSLANLLTGGSGANALVGGDGNDTLSGGLGQDTLTGGLGNDFFRFDTALGATNVDRIADYSVLDDTLQLENALFTALATPGVLAAGSLIAGAGFTTALDADDRVIYDSTTGALYYDADGSGAGVAAVQFGSVSGGLLLTNADFVVI